MPAHHRCLLALVLQVALSSTAWAFAFEEKAFCAAAQQFAFAANQDADRWLDRTTRSGGMAVFCDKRIVEVRRLTYAPSDTLNESWQQREAQAFNTTHCGNPIWEDAIANGWRITLTITATDGARISINAQCGDERQHSPPTPPANHNPPPVARTGTGSVSSTDTTTTAQ